MKIRVKEKVRIQATPAKAVVLEAGIQEVEDSVAKTAINIGFAELVTESKKQTAPENTPQKTVAKKAAKKKAPRNKSAL